ncbi:MAG: LysR family transcriptional regulator [Pseudomonadales bacterium]|nr:LysR family transcriptional regulator [Pseudomonadales bacterium]
MPFNKPTLRQLEYFIAIAQHRTFRRAADALGISQPTLTAQMNALEETLNAKILERSRNGAILTPIGRRLLPNARRVVEELDSLVDKVNSTVLGANGTYRLGVSPTVGPYALPHILPHLHQQYQDLQFYVRESSPVILEQELQEGKLDLLLLPLPLVSQKFSVETLFEEPLHLVLPSGHKLAQQETVSLASLRDENVLTLEEQYHSYRQVRELCQKIGANVLQDYEGTSLDSLRQMVGMGMGIAFLPALYIASELSHGGELLVKDLEQEPLKRSHVLVWRPNSPNRSFYKQLAQEIRVLVQKNLADILKTNK